METNYAIDTLFLTLSGALVMFMALGFAMLESGLVRTKNTVEILTKNVVLYAIACVMYMLIGYDLMYSSPQGGIIPSFSAVFSFMFHTVGNEHSLEAVNAGGVKYPKNVDFFFQVVFAATAMSIVSGAVAERMKLWAFMLFAVFMTAFIYPVQGYWKWGGGFLNVLGFNDFAGSGIVHVAGATAALSGVLLLGARKGKYSKDGRVNVFPGANIPIAVLGTLVLWFGWFGFNGGSQLKISTVADANAVAAIFVNTNMAAVGGVVAATIVSRLLFGKADLTMILNGALVGLVTITAEPLTPSPLVATLIGAVAGVIVVFAIITLDRKLKIDDPVGAISVHGVGGTLGVLVVPLTNTGASFLNQLIGFGAIFAWVFITSTAIWFIIKKTLGIRISEEEEYEGADLSECGLEAYPEFKAPSS